LCAVDVVHLLLVHLQQEQPAQGRIVLTKRTATANSDVAQGILRLGVALLKQLNMTAG
jgi:hypothetical protein